MGEINGLKMNITEKSGFVIISLMADLFYLVIFGWTSALNLQKGYYDHLHTLCT